MRCKSSPLTPGGAGRVFFPHASHTDIATRSLLVAKCFVLLNTNGMQTFQARHIGSVRERG